MKKILLAAMSIIVLITVSVAQQKQSDNPDQHSATVNDEHLLMKDGKMYHSMNGKEMQMQNQMTLHNGTVMHSNGSYQLKNGKQRLLSNGQCMDMNGKRYRSHRMFQQNKMRMHNQNRHSGGNHHMNMSGHH